MAGSRKRLYEEFEGISDTRPQGEVHEDPQSSGFLVVNEEQHIWDYELL